MNNTEFFATHGFKPHGTVANSWDAFSSDGAVVLLLWGEPNQRVRDHEIAGAYLRVRCFSAEHHAASARQQAVGYAGRLKASRRSRPGRVGSLRCPRRRPVNVGQVSGRATRTSSASTQCWLLNGNPAATSTWFWAPR